MKDQPRAPLGGIESGGWRLVYNATPNASVRVREKVEEEMELSFSLGAWWCTREAGRSRTAGSRT